MNSDDWTLLLSVIGFLMSAYGLVLAFRAIWDETHRRNLHPGWRNTLDATQSRVRKALGRKGDAHALSGTASINLHASGQLSINKATGVLYTEPQTVEELAAHVDRQIAQVREAINAQANDAASRIDVFNVRVTDGLADVATRLEEAERVAADIDAHTLDREMWGLLWVAGGSLLQALAMFVGR